MALTHECPFGQNFRMLLATVINAVALTGPNSYADGASASLVNAVDSHASYPTQVGPNGAFCVSATALPRMSVTDSQLGMWISVDNGATKKLVATAKMPTYVLSASTENPRVVFKNSNGTAISQANPLPLPADAKIYFGTCVTWTSGVDCCAIICDL
jgi:hypothetical protein